MTPADPPSWTDANSSDPGIALLELLAYLADTLSYRQDAVQAERRRSVFVAAVAGALAAALGCWWFCARRAASDR